MRRTTIVLVSLCLSVVALATCSLPDLEKQREVLAVAYSRTPPAGSAPRLAVAFSGGTHIYETDSWTEVQFLWTGASISAVSWSPDGQYLALTQIIRGNTGNTQVWRVGTGKMLYTLPVTGTVVAWSPDGSRLAIGGYHGLQVWDTETRERLYSFGDFWTQAVAWSPDGHLLAAGAVGDGAVFVLDAHNGELKETVDLQRRSADGSFAVYFVSVYCLAWHPSGSMLAIGGEPANETDGIVLWEPGQEGLRILHPPGIDNPIPVVDNGLPEHLRFNVANLAWSPDGRLLAVQDEYLWGFLWDAQEDSWYVLGYEVQDNTRPTDFLLSWAPQGEFVATSARGNTEVSIWDIAVAKQHKWSAPSSGKDIENMRQEAISSRFRVISLLSSR